MHPAGTPGDAGAKFGAGIGQPGIEHDDGGTGASSAHGADDGWLADQRQALGQMQISLGVFHDRRDLRPLQDTLQCGSVANADQPHRQVRIIAQHDGIVCPQCGMSALFDLAIAFSAQSEGRVVF
ncbi:MAG: hypothetical protein IPP85_14670 [Propionivibrio sp.]|nr:hypothetical protein [Propionivibrio sp.]